MLPISEYPQQLCPKRHNIGFQIKPFLRAKRSGSSGLWAISGFNLAGLNQQSEIRRSDPVDATSEDVSSGFVRRQPSESALALSCVVHFCLIIGEKGEKPTIRLAPLGDRRLLRPALLCFILFPP